MKKNKVILFASVAALAVMLAVSNARAASAEEKAAKKAETLEKYDANKDGKINRDERAVKKADDDAEKAKRKEEREQKKKAKEEMKTP